MTSTMKRARSLAHRLWIDSVASLLVAAGVGLGGMARGTPASSIPGSTSTTDPVLALGAIDRRIVENDRADQNIQTELTAVAGGLSEVHARVLLHGRTFYRLTRAGLLPVAGGFGAFVTHAMHVERARRLVALEIGRERTLHARAETLAHAREQIARDRIDLAAQREALDSARVASEDEARRRVAFDHAFQTSTSTPADYVPVYGARGALAPDVLTGGFAAARGRLLFPVLGQADARPARREGTSSPALEIRAPAGSVVRAVFPGRVAFADRYGPYGRLIIIDHGAHYYTVSGNLDELDVRTGQDVGAGERIGTVGDDGAGPMLHFEVRQGSQTVPPAPWLGL